MSRDRFAQEVAVLSRRWRLRLDERLRHTGLTQARWYALLELSKHAQGLTQRELAEQVGVEASTLVRHLDELERQEIISRSPLDGDRRANLVRPTAKAEPLLREINEIAATLRAELLGDLPEQDLDSCIALLNRVNRKLEQR